MHYGLGVLPARPRKPRDNPVAPGLVAEAQRAAEQVGITIDELAVIYLLDSVKYLGPQAFKELHEAGYRPLDACKKPEVLPTTGKRGDKIRQQLTLEVEKDQQIFQDRAVRQILAAHKHDAHILTYHHASYPRNVYISNYPAPVL